tara:strand:+ start:1071 stop:1253 length:183 start_codon:yes stop_codon:yes gene_type:complete
MGFFKKLFNYSKEVVCSHKKYKQYGWAQLEVRKCLKCGLEDIETTKKGRLGFHEITQGKP